MEIVIQSDSIHFAQGICYKETVLDTSQTPCPAWGGGDDGLSLEEFIQRLPKELEKCEKQGIKKTDPIRDLVRCVLSLSFFIYLPSSIKEGFDDFFYFPNMSILENVTFPFVGRKIGYLRKGASHDEGRIWI